MATRTIKGHVWINGNSLVQEQILVVEGVDSFSNTVVLIPDIWEDLTSESGLYKSNEAKNYFFWEYDITQMEDDVDIKAHFDCPRPKEGLFTEPYDPSKVKGDYAKFWVAKLKKADENSKLRSTIQKKEISFPGCTYVTQTGEKVTLKDTKESNTDIGDITNLLGMF